MQIQINPGDVEATEPLEEHIRNEIEDKLKHVANQVTRVEVHLHDTRGPKHGVDKRCMMEARLSGLDPIAVDHDSEQMYDAVEGAAGKLSRAINHKLGKLNDRKKASR